MTRVRGQLLSFLDGRQKHLGFRANRGFCIASPCCGAGVVVFRSSRSPKRNRLSRSVSSPPWIGGDRLLFCCFMKIQENPESTNTKASWKKTSSCCKGLFVSRCVAVFRSSDNTKIRRHRGAFAHSSSSLARWCLHDSPPLSHVTAGVLSSFFFTRLTSTNTVIT